MIGWPKLFSGYLFSAALLVLPIQTFAAADDCAQCDKKLELTDAQWQCFRKQLPALTARKTKFVFFSVDGPQCSAAASERVRSADTRMPPSRANAPRVFRMTNGQLACLSGKVDRITPRSSRYIVDLTTLCPTAAR
jgi:hypothetical protein